MMSESQIIENPVHSAGGTMSGKMIELTEEIREGILNLNGADTKRADLQAELNQIVEIASKENYPEAVVILFFRKYADIANRLKDNNTEQNQNRWEFPSFVEENHDSDLITTPPYQKKIFWLRVGVIILSFISFVIMSTISQFGFNCYEPKRILSYGCAINYMEGCFNYVPYKVMIAIGVTTFVYNAVSLVYYYLPLDEHQQRHIPGLAKVLKIFLSPQLVHGTFVPHGNKLITFFTDGLVFCGATATAISASIEVEFPVKFSYANSSYLSLKTYFTIGSFYATFTQTSPVCVDLINDPGPKIRASLAMMYLALFFMALCCISSALTYRKEVKNVPEQRGVEGVEFTTLSPPLTTAGNEAVV